MMKNTALRLVRLLLLVVVSFWGSPVAGQADAPPAWSAGVARVVITPDEPMWMAGFGFRDRSSEGTRHELWAKALALEDAQGNRGVLITADLLGIPKSMSDTIRDRIHARYELSRAQVMLNSSHTHTGPVLEDALVDIYPLDAGQRARVARYSRQLEQQMVALVGAALQTMRPARLYADNGVARFAVNRRNNSAETLHQQTALQGPSDHAVPVLKVESDAGEVIAVVFGYACHTTTLSDYTWSGDYAGFAQQEVEKMYPEATALFFQGAGADQNPLPRGTAELASQYGRDLASAVERVLQEKMRPLAAQLSTAYSEVELRLTPPPSRDELAQRAAAASGYPARWAHRLIEQIDNGEPFLRAYPFPVQAWRLGNQPIFAMGGELVVDYAVALKQIFGYDTFVMGYTNDVMAYIPTVNILREGGYEGKTSQMVYGLPSPWASDIETLILSETLTVAREAGIPVQ